MSKPDDSNGKVWVPRCAITFDPNALDDELNLTRAKREAPPPREPQKGSRGRR